MRAALILLFAVACKEPATHVVSLEGACSEGALQLVVIEGGRCGDCVCGACLEQCTGETCTYPCGFGACLGEVTFDPPGNGDVALIAQTLEADENGVMHVVGVGCAEIDIDPDGTEARTFTVEVACCAAP